MTKAATELLLQVSGAERALLTTSCTHALEMAALLLDLAPGDEVIVPSLHVRVDGGGRARCAARRRCSSTSDPTRSTSTTPPLRPPSPTARRRCSSCTTAAWPQTWTRCSTSPPGTGLQIVEDNAHGLGAHASRQRLGHLRRARDAELPRDQERALRRGRRAAGQRRARRGAGRDHAREGHRPVALPPRPGRQVHLGRHRLELPAERPARRRARAASSSPSTTCSSCATRSGTPMPAGWPPGRREHGVRLMHVPDDADHPAHVFYLMMPTTSTQTDLLTPPARPGDHRHVPLRAAGLQPRRPGLRPHAGALHGHRGLVRAPGAAAAVRRHDRSGRGARRRGGHVLRRRPGWCYIGRGLTR